MLAGKKAVVTGSSTGIGRAVALELARAGAEVLVHAGHRRQAAQAVVDEISAIGRHTDYCMADLAEPAARDALVEQAWSWGDEIDIWINNAGVDVLTGPAAKWSFEQKLDALWRVDVQATLFLARKAGRRMKRRGAGVVLNIGWDQAERGMAGDSGELFAVTKGAIMAFTKSLAQSLAPEVRVNCLAPGWIKTAWASGASQAWQSRARRESQLQRWGTPQDVAQVAAFLVSPAAGFMTGQVVAVNGGFRRD